MHGYNMVESLNVWYNIASVNGTNYYIDTYYFPNTVQLLKQRLCTGGFTAINIILHR